MDVVSAATMAPVSSCWQSLRVIAARITASCHSSGVARPRVQARHSSVVRSSIVSTAACTSPEKLSSGPRKKCSGRSTRNHCSSQRRPTGALVVSRSEEHTSELQSLMRISYAVFCLKKKKNTLQDTTHQHDKTKNNI